MVKRLIAALIVVASTFVAQAQQPQTHTAPIYRANAKYVQGVGPGYWPTAGSGLTLNVAAGTAFCSGNVITYAAGTLTMTASATNYVYLNTSSSCVPAVKTTAFTVSDIPIATVPAGSAAITSIADDRTMFQQGGSVGSSLSVDGTAVSTPNLDSTTPAPDSGYTLGKWKQSGGNISLEVPSPGAGGGVQYNASNTIYMWTGDSRLLDDAHNLGATITATAVNCNGTVCIVTAPNSYVAGQWIEIYGSFSPSFLPIGAVSTGTGYGIYQVIATGLSSSQFEFAYTANIGTGTGGTIEDASYLVPFYTANLPYFNGHGTPMIEYSPTGGMTIQAEAANYSTIFHAYSPAVTGQPGFFIIEGGINDLQADCESYPTLQGQIASLWTQAHTDGWTVVQTTIPTFGINESLCSGWSPNGLMLEAYNVNTWVLSQAKSSANASSGAYWDKIVDVASLETNQSFVNTTGALEYSPAGVGVFANAMNEAMGVQGASISAYPNILGLFDSGAIFTLPALWLNFCDTATYTICPLQIDANENQIHVNNVQISSLGASTAPLCTGTGGLVTNSGCAAGSLASQAADTIMMNASASSAAPLAVALPTGCTNGVNYSSSTHSWTCVSGSGGGGAGAPQIRGSGIQTNWASPYTVSFPTGTIAGDFAVVLVGNSYPVSTPSGWSVADAPTDTYFNGNVFYKTLNASDISAGSVTLTSSGANQSSTAIITFQGATAGIRETESLLAGEGTSATSVLQTATDSSIAATDIAIYFGSNRATSTDTVSLGTLLQTVNGGCLYTQTGLAAGVPLQPTFYYSANALGYYQATVIVKGV